MSIWDTISSSVGSLFDGDASGAWDTLSNIKGDDLFSAAKGAVKGYDALMKGDKAAAQDDRNLLSFLERNSRLQNTDNNWANENQPNKAGFGAQNYSADYKQIQAEWTSFLTGVAGSKTVPGKRYSELN